MCAAQMTKCSQHQASQPFSEMKVTKRSCDPDFEFFDKEAEACYQKMVGLTFGGKYDQWVSGEAYSGDENFAKMETIIDGSSGSEVVVPEPENEYLGWGAIFGQEKFRVIFPMS